MNNVGRQRLTERNDFASQRVTSCMLRGEIIAANKYLSSQVPRASCACRSGFGVPTRPSPPKLRDLNRSRNLDIYKEEQAKVSRNSSVSVQLLINSSVQQSQSHTQFQFHFIAMASERIQVMRSIDDRSAKQDQGVGVLKEPVCFRVPRNPEMPRDKAKDRVDELLVLEAVDIPGCQLALDVFINLPDADHKTPANVAEYVGSFYCISPRMSNQTFPIRANLEILGLEDAKEIVVTVVPKGTCQTEVPIKGARIVYD